MAKYTKAQFDRVIKEAESLLHGGDSENAMAILALEVSALDQALIWGKWVDELRMVSNRYERIHLAKLSQL